MFEDIYHLANTLWPLWGMLLFLGIVGWAFWPSNKAKFESHGHIPLDDDEPNRPSADHKKTD